MARHNKCKRAWLHEHIHDYYVQQAKRQQYRSRAAFKLLALQQTDKLFSGGDWVADLGAAPGSWSQVARQAVGANGKVFAIDCLPMAPIPGVEVLCGDFSDPEILAVFVAPLQKRQLDLVICDIAPNLTGVRVIDQAKSIYLNELALLFCQEHLKIGGHFLVKTFQGEGFNAYKQWMQLLFHTVVSRKPQASRDRSKELYLLGKHKRQRTQSKE